MRPEHHVRDSGAVGDGAHLDTAAIQSAIDACHAAGGGRVCLGPGTYRSGTLYLKSHVELHLQAGAVLRATADRAAYNPDDVFPENEVFPTEQVTGAHLLIAYRAENVAITGHGTIDGNSAAFFAPLPPDKTSTSYRSKSCSFPIHDWRPAQMLFFCRCRDVALRDVTLRNAPFWTCFLLGCRDVRIRGMLVENPPQTLNGDGFDIDCCRNVTVSDCIVRTGDDCITVRGNTAPLGEDLPCENVVVSNCILQSPCNAIRVGVGDGAVRDCLFSNIVVAESRTGISIISRWGDYGVTGARIERIRFANLRLDTVVPLHVHTGTGTPPGGIRDIDFHGFQASAFAGSYVGGRVDNVLERIRFTDWDLRVSGGTDNLEFVEGVPDPYWLVGAPGLHNGPALPAALCVRHARDVALHDVRVRWDEKLGAVWRHALQLDRVVGLQLRDVQSPSPRTGEPGSIRK